MVALAAMLLAIPASAFDSATSPDCAHAPCLELANLSPAFSSDVVSTGAPEPRRAANHAAALPVPRQAIFTGLGLVGLAFYGRRRQPVR